MITFKQFLTEAPITSKRTRKVDVDALIAWADENAKGYLSGSNFFYRGGSGSGSEYFMLGSSTLGEPRTSANTNNNYTLWFDNSPAFKDWPKRSRAFIASNSVIDVEPYGQPALLIIADNAKVGIVQEGDMWGVEVIPGVEHSNLETWNGTVEAILNALGKGRNKTFAGLEAGLKFATAERIQAAIDDKNEFVHVEAFKAFIDFLEKYKFENLYQLWQKFMTPKLFKQTTGAKISKSKVNGEIWIEGECAFILSGIGDEIDEDDEEILEKLFNWAKKYKSFQNELGNAIDGDI